MSMMKIVTCSTYRAHAPVSKSAAMAWSVRALGEPWIVTPEVPQQTRVSQVRALSAERMRCLKAWKCAQNDESRYL
jgi:hypothetical protein